MTFKALLVGCWFRHDHVRTRNAKQEPVLKCMDCGDEQPMFASEIIRGPKSEPDQVLGKPIGKVTRALPRNVREFTRDSQR